MKKVILIVAIVIAGYWFFSDRGTGTVAKDTIVLYGTSWCEYCQQAKAQLSKGHVRWIEYDVEKDYDGRRLYKRLGGGVIPIIQADDTIIRGYSKDALVGLMEDPRYQR